MAERIQLKDPGSELTMTVGSVTPQTVERNDYFLFGFSSGKLELLVPQSSVKGRFERLGITQVEQMIGKTIRFARSMKMSRANAPYWDIDVVPNGSGAEAPSQSDGTHGVEFRVPINSSAGGAQPMLTPQNSVHTPRGLITVPPEPGDRPKLDRIYIRATRLILDEVVPMYTKAGIGCSDSAVAAMVATVFIAASKVEAH